MAKHDNLQSALWKEQIKKDLHGYNGPRKQDLQKGNRYD
jgi:hypothetical protein